MCQCVQSSVGSIERGQDLHDTHHTNDGAAVIINQENTRGQRGTLRALVVICHRSTLKLFLVSGSQFSETSVQITTSI